MTNATWGIGTDGNGTSGKVALWLQSDDATILLNDVLSTGTAFDSTWHHIVWTDNNGTAKLYIDAKLDATNFNYTRKTTTLLNTFIGSQKATDQFFNGTIDDVRVYSRVLSAAEVRRLYIGNDVMGSGF